MHLRPITNSRRTLFPALTFSLYLRCLLALGGLVALQSCGPKMLSNNPLAQKIRAGAVARLSDTVNTASLDYAPVVMPDGKRLYFISDREGSMATESKPDAKPRPSHDFWFVDVLNDNANLFSRAVNADTSHTYGAKSLNTAQNEGGGTYCQATRELYFTGCNRPGGFGDCDIYAVKLNANGEWGEVRNLGIIVNSGNWESQPAISPDGLTLLFASNRIRTDIKELLGNRELPIRLWCATRKSVTEEWGTPFYVPELNPGGKNWSPFICADGKTLIFASDAPGGFGGLDFLISERGADGKWSKPENIGEPLNTDEDESFISIPARGNVLYFSARNRASYYSTRSMDIHIMRLPSVAP